MCRVSNPNLETEVAGLVSGNQDALIYLGDCIDLLAALPERSVQLIITSPPYNIGKEYERRRSLDLYIQEQAKTIAACYRVLREGGSLCWQVGNHIGGTAKAQEVFPLDIILYPLFKELGLKLRNRIVWHFEHGLHCSKRFSGRHETILWFTLGDDYVFNLDPIRVPQKYPGKKQYKGPRIGEYSCNPLGKNPGDVWIFPNVKHNHVEKTIHPCQFPVELVERFVLSCTNPGDIVLDPYAGVMTTVAAAVAHGRRGVGAEVVAEYIEVGRQRVDLARAGLLRTRPMDRPVYEPSDDSHIARRPAKLSATRESHNGDDNQQTPPSRQLSLIE
ncbi:MAG TPA: site-specific DNA-methyltransferase [Chloroflexota bacterium]|nr:site-specific DNA-methyltransferase [Chloroflexota bacterium]